MTIAIRRFGAAQWPAKILEPAKGADGDPPVRNAVRGLPYYLPKTTLPITVTGAFVANPNLKTTDPTPVEYQISVQFGTPTQVADPSSVYLLVYDLGTWTDDQTTISAGPNGLLTTANAQSTDQSGSAIAAVASLAATLSGVGGLIPQANFVKGAGGGNHATPLSDTDRRANCFSELQAFQYAGQIDASAIDADVNPTGEFQTQLKSINDAVAGQMLKTGTKQTGSTVLLNAEFVAYTPPAYNVGPVPTDNAATDKNGILFRLTVPHDFALMLQPAGLTFTDQGGAHPCIPAQPQIRIAATAVPVAERNLLFAVDTSRAAMVTKTVNVTVTDGVLTGVSVTKPSEGLAIVKFPLTVLNAITSALLGNLTGRSTAINDQSGILQAQVSLLTQAQALQTAKQNAQQNQAH